MKLILRSFRIFAGFALRPMHRSDKGPKIVPPLFGFRSPFGHPRFRNSLLEGRASPHLCHSRRHAERGCEAPPLLGDPCCKTQGPGTQGTLVVGPRDP